MSAIALIWAANVKGLKPSTKIVLIQLAERHNKDTGQCNPRLSLLADDCEMSRASLLRHLGYLEEMGYVTRVAQGRDFGGRAPSQYDLHMEQRSQIETGGKGLISDEQRSQIGGGKGLTDETPYIEPVLNQEEPSAQECALSLFSEKEQQDSETETSEIPCSKKENQSKEKADADFDRFWQAYPKKAGKPAARKAWDKAIKKDLPEKIISAAGRYATWLKEPCKPGDFRPHAKHPQGWLNDERWNDPELQEATERPVSDMVRRARAMTAGY